MLSNDEIPRRWLGYSQVPCWTAAAGFPAFDFACTRSTDSERNITLRIPMAIGFPLMRFFIADSNTSTTQSVTTRSCLIDVVAKRLPNVIYIISTGKELIGRGHKWQQANDEY